MIITIIVIMMIINNTEKHFNNNNDNYNVKKLQKTISVPNEIVCRVKNNKEKAENCGTFAFNVLDNAGIDPSFLKSGENAVVSDTWGTNNMIEEKKNPGFFYWMHKRRKEGKKPHKPGEEGYPNHRDSNSNPLPAWLESAVVRQEALACCGHLSVTM